MDIVKIFYNYRFEQFNSYLTKDPNSQSMKFLKNKTDPSFANLNPSLNQRYLIRQTGKHKQKIASSYFIIRELQY